MRRVFCITISMLLMLLCITTYAAQYAVTDLGTLGGNASYANAINNNGWVVGSSKNLNGQDRAFVWKPGEGMSNLGTLGGSYSDAYAINDNGQVTGRALPSTGNYSAFMWSPGGTMTDLPKAPGAASEWHEGRAINRYGQVAGSLAWVYGLTWPLGGSAVPLMKYDMLECDARGINDSGLIVGRAIVQTHVYTNPTESRASYWLGGQSGFLPTFSGYAQGTALSVNAANQIVGSAPVNGVDHPVLWTNFNTIVDLGTFGGNAYGTDGYANDVNDLMQVVGTCKNPSRADRAFIWDSGAGMVDLNTLVDPSLGWTLTKATSINNDGWIVGSGIINGETHAFLLTQVVPEPGSLLVLGSGLVGLLAFRRRNR